MQKFVKHIIIVIALIASTFSKVSAQVDTVFWFAASWVTPDHANNLPMAFHFSTFNNPTTIRLRQPASTYDTTFLVPANALFTKYVSHIVDSLESKPADNVLRTGFQITSDNPIVVVYDFLSTMPSTNNAETYSLKGQNGMGYEFVVPFQTLWNNKILGTDNSGDGVVTQPKQQFTIVAAEDSALVYITPRCAVVGGHPANTTYSVLLPKAGNTYTVENLVSNTSLAGNSLAGSIVVSNKKVSVTISDDSVNPSGGGGCYDLMGDQIVPTDVIGTDYIVNKGFLNAGSDESAFIVATKNFTTVTIDNGITISSVILNQGDTYQYSITEQLTYIQADKNVYVLHMSGYGCELGQAILPPLNCAGSDQVSFPRTNSHSFLLDLLCPAGAEGNFLVNGLNNIVVAGDFSPVPGTGGAWMGAQVDIPTGVIASGSSNIITNSSDLFSLGIINGTSTGGCLYHYLSIFNRKVIVDAGNDTTLCNGEPQIDLVGSVEGGTITGEWTILNGTGTLNAPTSLVTSYIPSASDYAQGSLTFLLSSTGNCDPVVDSFKVDFIQSPIVNTIGDDSLCKNNISTIPISGTVQYAAGASWSGGFGGAFANAGSANTTYTPSPTDLSNDSVALYFTSGGSYFSCPNDQDTVIVYFTEPPVVIAGPDQVVCAGATEANLSGLVNGTTSTGVWSTSGSGTFDSSEFDLVTDYLITTSDTTNGLVVLTLTSTNNGGCLAVSDSLELTILDQPSINITSSDSVCSNLFSFDLDGTVSSGFSTEWSTSGVGSIVSSTSLNTFYNIHPVDTANGFVDVFLSTSGGICPIEYDSMRVHFINPPRAYAGLDAEFCNNEFIQLNGSVNGISSSESWTSTGTGVFNPSNNLLSTIYEPSASDVANGTLLLILTSDNNFGCPSDKDTLSVTFKPSPIADYSFTEACFGSNTEFSDLSSVSTGTIVSWSWDFGDMTTSIADDPLHNYPGPGTYDAMLIAESSNGCFDTIVKTINVNPSPVASFTQIPACINEEVTFEDNSFISSGSIITYSYDFGDGTPVGINANETHVYSALGDYGLSYTVTSNLGCSDTYNTVVSVLPGPDADFEMTPNPALAYEDVQYTDLSTGNGIVDWEWFVGDGNGYDVQNPIHAYSGGGAYTVTLTVTDDNGCVDTTSQEILIALLPVLPTAFTPNGDGENDYFVIRGGPFTAVDFKVYSNWGELIFQTTEQSPGWDGTYKNKPAPLGVYTWTYEVEIPGGRYIIESGDVTLIR